MNYMKELLLQMKGKKAPSVEGDNSVNKEKSSEDEAEDEGTEEEEDKLLCSWVKKVELPTFEGHDPLGWLARAEFFLEVKQVKPTKRLQLAFISMEGNAFHWF